MSKSWIWFNFSVLESELFEFICDVFSLYEALTDSINASFDFASNWFEFKVELAIEDSLIFILESNSDFILFNSTCFFKATASFGLVFKVELRSVNSLLIEANNSLSKLWSWTNFSDSDNLLSPVIWAFFSL